MALRQCVAILALEVARNGFVEFVFLFGGGERPGEQPTLRVFHILQHLASQRPVAEMSESLTECGEVSTGIGELRAK